MSNTATTRTSGFRRLRRTGRLWRVVVSAVDGVVVGALMIIPIVWVIRAMATLTAARRRAVPVRTTALQRTLTARHRSGRPTTPTRLRPHAQGTSALPTERKIK